MGRDRPTIRVNVAAVLISIDRRRKKLQDDFWREMAKLNNEEREVLGLTPIDGTVDE